MNTIPQPPGGGPLAEQVDRLRRESIYGELVGDELASLLELRIAALEEALTSRRARRRLRRALAASAAKYAWAGGFAARRIEAMGDEWLAGRNLSSRWTPR